MCRLDAPLRTIPENPLGLGDLNNQLPFRTEKASFVDSGLTRPMFPYRLTHLISRRICPDRCIEPCVRRHARIPCPWRLYGGSQLPQKDDRGRKHTDHQFHSPHLMGRQATHPRWQPTKLRSSAALVGRGIFALARSRPPLCAQCRTLLFRQLRPAVLSRPRRAPQ